MLDCVATGPGFNPGLGHLAKMFISRKFDIFLRVSRQGAKIDHFVSYHQGLYSFLPSTLAIFSWRAIASQIHMCPAKPDIKIGCWLVIARQEKIDTLLNVHLNAL